MAFFKRPELEAQGITGNAQDWLMAELNRRLSVNYVSKDEAKEQADAAVQAALKDAPQAVDPTTTDAYKTLLAENDKLKTFNSEEFSAIKPKFRDYVYGKIDRNEGAASVADQLAAMREELGEVFEASETTTAKPADTTPRFGAPVTGSMQKPEATSFSSVWGFGAKRKE